MFAQGLAQSAPPTSLWPCLDLRSRVHCDEGALCSETAQPASCMPVTSSVVSGKVLTIVCLTFLIC